MKIDKDAEVKFGKDFVCRSSPLYCIDCGYSSKIIVRGNAKLHIGNYSGMANSIIQCHESITIGDYVNIGAGCLIMDTNFHSTSWHIRLNRREDVKHAKHAPVNIGNNVFIGARCVIMKGVTIGDKAMVSAGSVVMGNIPSLELWGGNPAKFIKKLS